MHNASRTLSHDVNAPCAQEQLERRVIRLARHVEMHERELVADRGIDAFEAMLVVKRRYGIG